MSLTAAVMKVRSTSTIQPFASQVFAVHPSAFRCNQEALADNVFMDAAIDCDSAEFDEKVKAQHAEFVSNIRNAGIPVTVYQQPGDAAPDAIFPDWFTCYKGDAIPGGVLILHPMKYLSRRNERAPEIVASLKAKFKHCIDLTEFEKRGLALEGKGAIVFHHRARCFLIARSERSCPEVIDTLVTEWNKLSKVPYRAVTFEARDTSD
jgi:hypothetical protein